MDLTLLELVEKIGKVKVPEDECFLTIFVSCLDANDDDVEAPDVIAKVR